MQRQTQVDIQAQCNGVLIDQISLPISCSFRSSKRACATSTWAHENGILQILRVHSVKDKMGLHSPRIYKVPCKKAGGTLEEGCYPHHALASPGKGEVRRQPRNGAEEAGCRPTPSSLLPCATTPVAATKTRPGQIERPNCRVNCIMNTEKKHMQLTLATAEIHCKNLAQSCNQRGTRRASSQGTEI